MKKIDFEYGLFGKLRAAAAEDWDAYVRHPFVRQNWAPANCRNPASGDS